MTFFTQGSVRQALLAAAMTCLCVIAQADTLTVEGLPIRVGSNVKEVQQSLHTMQEPEDMASTRPFMLKQSQIHLKDAGIWVFFNQAGVSQTIRIDAPFAGSVGGIKIGTSHAYIVDNLGKPAIELTTWAVTPGVQTPILYNIDPATLVRFDFDVNDTVTTMYIVHAAQNTQAAARTTGPVRLTPQAPAYAVRQSAGKIGLAKPAPQAPDDIKDMLNSPTAQTFMAVAKDLQPLFRRDTDLKQTLSHLNTFQFSDETRKKLYDLTGNDNPLHVKTTKLRSGNTELAVAIDALDFKDAQSGASWHIAESDGELSFNPGLNKMHTTASFPLLHVETAKGAQLTAGDISMLSDQQRGAYGMWVGTGKFRLGQLTLDGSNSKIHVTLDDLITKTEVKPHGKSVDITSDTSIKSINWGDDGLSQLHVGIRLTNLNAKDIAAIEETARNLNQNPHSVEERLQAANALLKDFGRSMQHGGAINIQDISAKYHGMTGGLDGRIVLDNAQDSDFDSIEALLKKLNVRINVHVPLDWINDISRTVTHNTLEKDNKSGQAVDDAAVEAVSKTGVTKQLNDLEQKKWIRVDHGTILSTIEFKGGKLLINGQPFSFPTLPDAVPATSQTGKTIARVIDMRAHVMVPGETLVLATGQSVNFSAPATISMPNGIVLNVEGNKNKNNVLPGARVTVSASATGPADNVAVVVGTEVTHADFGLFHPLRSGKPVFFPNKLVPFVPNQSYGWMIHLHTDKTIVKWKEELTLPDRPATWGTPELSSDRIFSEDGRTVTTEKKVAPIQGAISNAWSVDSGDPKGHYVMRVTVEDTPTQVFEFDVQ